MPLRIGSCLCSGAQEQTHQRSSRWREGVTVGKVETETMAQMAEAHTSRVNEHAVYSITQSVHIYMISSSENVSIIGYQRG